MQSLGFLKNMINKISIKTSKVVFIISLMVFTSTLCTKLFFCGSVAIRSGELEDIFARRESLKKEISLLTYESSSLSRIELIEEKALSLGFIEMTDGLLSLDVSAPDQVAVLTQ